jgi:hypothetical protein
MSDLNLLVFGCVVSFIAVAGAYLYVRESFTGEEDPSESRARSVERKVRDAA